MQQGDNTEAPQQSGLPISAKPKLIAELKRYNLDDTVKRIAALLTFPGLQHRTLRIEILIHLAVAYCQGRKKASRGRILQWIERSLASYDHTEDPPEEVFVHNICLATGNARIFPGIWESAGLYIQLCVDIFARGHVPETLQPIGRNLEALLKLSDAVAERSGLRRWSGDDNFKWGEKIDLPGHQEIVDRSTIFSFSIEDLAELKIDKEDLEPFICRDVESIRNLSGGIGQSNLERQPIIFSHEQFIFAIPTAISPCIRRYVLHEASRRKFPDDFQYLMEKSFIRYFDRVFLKFSDTRQIDRTFEIPMFSDASPNIEVRISSFDGNKILIFIAFYDSVKDTIDNGIMSFFKNDASSAKSLGKYVSELEDRFRAQGFDDGLLLVTACGLGRPTSVGLDTQLERWSMLTLSPDSVQVLADDEGWSALRLWKFSKRLNDLEKKKISIVPPFDMFLIYCFWKENNYSFIPHEAQYPGINIINIGFEFALPTKIKIRRSVDRHTIIINRYWRTIEVSRYAPNTYYSYDKNLPIYISEDLARLKLLFGCVEINGYIWSIEFNRRKSDVPNSIKFIFWEACLNWLYHIFSFLESSSAAKVVSDCHFVFDLSEAFSKLGEDNLVDYEVGTRIEILRSHVKIFLGSEVIPMFMRSTNEGDRFIASSLLKGLCQYGAVSLEDESEADIDVVGSDDRRYIHLYRAVRLEHRISMLFDDRKPRLVQPEDVAFHELGLSWNIVDQETRVIEGRQECIRFLNSVVDFLWKKMKSELAIFDRSSVIVLALENLEALDGENRRWQSTTRSLHAFSGDEAEFYEETTALRQKRDHASLCYRVLVEMAVCESPYEGGTLATTASIDSLIAQISILLQMAGRSDAIHFDISAACLRLRQNGEVATDDRDLQKLINDYGFAVGRETIEESIEKYAELYTEKSIQDRNDNELNSDFYAAFVEEYKIKFQDVLECFQIMLDEAFRLNKNLFSVEIKQFEEMLGNKLDAQGDRIVQEDVCLLAPTKLGCSSRGIQAPI